MTEAQQKAFEKAAKKASVYQNTSRAYAIRYGR
jgi:hypothetical protein